MLIPSLFLAVLIQSSEQHPSGVDVGVRSAMIDPPCRSIIGKVKPQCDLPWNLKDEGKLYCGGVSVQHDFINKGRCGVCGDPWSGPHPHQAGGRYATGTIARSYEPGQIIDVNIDLASKYSLAQVEKIFESTEFRYLVNIFSNLGIFYVCHLSK